MNPYYDLSCSGNNEIEVPNCESSGDSLCHNWCEFPKQTEDCLRCSNTCIDLKEKPYKTSFDQLTIQKRIQNQSRASEGRYMDNKNAVIVASNFFCLFGSSQKLV